MCRIALLALVLVSTQIGCSTAVKQAFYEVRGAKGEFVSQRGTRPATLDSYQSIQFRNAHSDIGGRIVPSHLLATYDAAAAATQTQLSGSGNPVEVDTNILYYEGKGLLGSAFLLAHIKMYGNGSVLDEGLIKVVSKSFRAGDPEDMATEATETIAEYILGRSEGLFGDDDEDDDEN
ncbi:MAG: hypothetical protein AB7N71_07845 [Phycisphaerae bacterium]